MTEDKKPDPYEGKEIVFESITSRVLILILLLIATIFGIINTNYVIAIFAGIAFVVMIYRTTKTEFLPPTSQRYRDYIQQQVDDWDNGSHNFAYDDNGFFWILGGANSYHKWEDIELILGYQPYTHMQELAALQISMQDGYKCRVTYNTMGWKLFLQKLNQHYPLPPRWWEHLTPAEEEGVVFPTVFYDRLNREQSVALLQYDQTLDDHNASGYIDNHGVKTES